MSAATNIASVIACIYWTEPLTQMKILQSYPEDLNHLLKTFASNQAAAGVYFIILRYNQAASITLVQYADSLHTKSCRVSTVHEESTLNDIFIRKVDFFLCNSPWEYWTTIKQADLTLITFTA